MIFALYSGDQSGSFAMWLNVFSKLAFGKADVGVRIDVGKRRGTIVGYDGEEGHIIEFDKETTKKDAKITFFDLNVLNCVVHGRVSSTCLFLHNLTPLSWCVCCSYSHSMNDLLCYFTGRGSCGSRSGCGIHWPDSW